MPVHLYGHPAAIDRIVAFAQPRGLAVLEDNAQAVGATLGDRAMGGWATWPAFVLPEEEPRPCGDGGMVVTTRDDVAERVRRLRHHGDTGPLPSRRARLLQRLDGEAAWLRVKLRAWRGTERRRGIAARYRDAWRLPLRLVERSGARHVYHLFTGRHPQRDALAKRLADAGVGTAVHYPLPVPGQPVFAADGARAGPRPTAPRARCSRCRASRDERRRSGRRDRGRAPRLRGSRMTPTARLRERLAGQPTIGVIGLGYVGSRWPWRSRSRPRR